MNSRTAKMCRKLATALYTTKPYLANLYHNPRHLARVIKKAWTAAPTPLKKPEHLFLSETGKPCLRRSKYSA
jgi:hypothetical protein